MVAHPHPRPLPCQQHHHRHLVQCVLVQAHRRRHPLLIHVHIISHRLRASNDLLQGEPAAAAVTSNMNISINLHRTMPMPMYHSPHQTHDLVFVTAVAVLALQSHPRLHLHVFDGSTIHTMRHCHFSTTPTTRVIIIIIEEMTIMKYRQLHCCPKTRLWEILALLLPIVVEMAVQKSHHHGYTRQN